MPNINITVAGKIATNRSPDVSIICGNADYTVTFDFDEEWSAHPVKTARFVFTKSGKLQYLETAFSGNVAQVPVLSGVDAVYVGAYAGELHTTTPTRVLCKRSILCGGGTHEEPAEDVYMQLLALLSNQAGGETCALGDFVESTEYPGCYYREVTTTVEYGTITEKEWLNPPMKNGVVYRTTKRFLQNRAVYVVNSHMGSISEGATKSISINCTQATNVNGIEYVLWLGYDGVFHSRFDCFDMDNNKTMWSGVSGYCYSDGGFVYAGLTASEGSLSETMDAWARVYVEFTANGWVY